MYDLVFDDTVARRWSTWRIWMLFSQASDVVYRAAWKRLRPIGVSLEQARVLLILSMSSSPPTRTQISKIVMREPHTITTLLNGMQRAGLIVRIKDEGNQKLVRVVMTQKGREVWEEILQAQLSMKLISVLSSEEICQLSSILEKIRGAALKELGRGQYQETIQSSDLGPP